MPPSSIARHLWVSDVIVTSLRFLATPDAAAQSLLSAALYLTFAYAFFDELVVLARLATHLTLLYPYLLLSLLLMRYSGSSRLPVKHALTLELVVLWLRYLYAPAAPSAAADGAARSLFGADGASRQCADEWKRALRALRTARDGDVRAQMRCAGEAAWRHRTRGAASFSAASADGRFALCLALTVLAFAVATSRNDDPREPLWRKAARAAGARRAR